MTDSSGPAFPSNYMHKHSNVEVHLQEWDGMTLRDYFAAKALVGLLSEGQRPNFEKLAKRDKIAEDPEGVLGGIAVLAMQSYWIADAMLAERSKQ